MTALICPFQDLEIAHSNRGIHTYLMLNYDADSVRRQWYLRLFLWCDGRQGQIAKSLVATVLPSC